MNIRQQLEQTLQRYEELERMMGDPQVLADSSKMAAVAREHGSLLKTATKYRQYKQLCDDIRRQVNPLFGRPTPQSPFTFAGQQDSFNSLRSSRTVDFIDQFLQAAVKLLRVYHCRYIDYDKRRIVP